MSTQTGPNVLLRTDLNSGGSGNNILCNGTGIIDASGSGNFKQSLQISNTSFSDYVFNCVSLASAQTFMMIAAIPPASSVPQTILIRKITIVETPPPFQMSPSSVTVNCGYPITQTFTVNNPGGIQGITGYTWNLGATPNGWIYNGNPAPQTINTSGNTLQLSSACINSAPKNVSATINVNNSPQSTVTSTVNFNAALPSYTVNGNASI